MFNGIIVVGMVSGHHTIEDIQTVVPYRVAVQIPGNLVQMSGDLKEALHLRKVFKLSGVVPAGSVFRGGPVKRAGAPNPVASQVQNTSEVRDLKALVQRLTAQLTESKERETQLQTLNTGLQSTLGVMSAQLTAIQGVLEDLRTKGIQVVGIGPMAVRPEGIEDDVPMFIPSMRDDQAKVNITVTEQASTTDLAASKAALKNLRKAKS